MLTHLLRAFLIVVIANGPGVAAGAGARSEPTLGTAGPFRILVGGACGVPADVQSKGACDPAPIVDGPPVEQSAALIKRATHLIYLLRFDQADAELARAGSLDRNNFDAHFLRARLALSRGQMGMADATLTEAAGLNPSDPDLLATRAFINAALGRLDASQLIERAFALAPDRPDILFIHAQFLMREARAGAARVDLDRLLTLEPTHEFALLLRAKSKLVSGDLGGAKLDCEQVLNLRPGFPDAVRMHASIHAAQGELGKAVDDLSGLLESTNAPDMRSPAVREARLERAMLLAKLGRVAEARNEALDLATSGGTAGVLRLQLHLRRHGFSDVEVSGRLNSETEKRLLECFANPDCASNLNRAI